MARSSTGHSKRKLSEQFVNSDTEEDDSQERPIAKRRTIIKLECSIFETNKFNGIQAMTACAGFLLASHTSIDILQF